MVFLSFLFDFPCHPFFKKIPKEGSSERFLFGQLRTTYKLLIINKLSIIYCPKHRPTLSDLVRKWFEVRTQSDRFYHVFGICPKVNLLDHSHIAQKKSLSDLSELKTGVSSFSQEIFSPHD